MKQFKFNRLLTGIILCLVLLVSIQCYWVARLVHWQRVEFNKSINLSIEKSLADERKQRTDSISKAIYNWMMDTSLTRITSKINPVYNKMVYSISDKSGSVKQKSSISLSFENRPITTQNDTVRKVVANYIVSKFRESYSDYQAVLFLTQTIGDSATFLSEKMLLDTSRIRKILLNNLLQQNIKTDFSLHLVKLSDSSAADNEVKKAKSITSLQTNLYKSDVTKSGEILYTYARFKKPLQWIWGKLFIPLLLSFLVLAGVSGLLLYFYKILRQQKILSAIKNDFIDNMTHELKTPISVISAAAEAMQQFGVLNDETKTQKYITNIRIHSAQLHTIVNKVLDISSFEKQETELTKTNFNFTELVQEIIKNYLFIRTNDKITVETEAPADVIWGDRFHVKNILFNLIDNALKYNDKDNAHIHITMKGTRENSSITVEDNGMGIEAKYIENIFDKFFRVPHGNIHKVKGFGLGLFYVKKIIELHGGSILAESTRGIKTKFTIILPNLKQ